MSSVETIHEPGDLIYTLAAGVVRVFSVEADGDVVEASPAVVRAMR